MADQTPWMSRPSKDPLARTNRRALSTQLALASRLTHLLAHRSLGLPLVALVVDVIAADARFEQWLASERKKLDRGAVLQAIAQYEEATEDCRRELERFIARCDSNPLAAALERTLGALKRAVPD